MATLLVIDDEPNVCYSLQKTLRTDSLEVITAPSAKQGIAMVSQHKPDGVVLDVRLPDMSGLDAFERIREIDPRLPVIIITAHATTETAIEAMKRGAFEYLLKPLDLPQLRETVAKAIHLSHLTRVPAVFTQDDDGDASVDRIVGLSPAMQQVYKDIGRVALQDVNVLVLGESGTGKELVARAIFSHSHRGGKPFLAINCAAIPEPLLESELFGHERGSFTSAARRRIGKFEQADHGTIFLDEIGDMTLATQAKILRLLQDGRFERVGGNETIQTDVRVIAATNQDLERAIAEGRFREDLYYRLKVFSITLPPLRQRKDDLPMLVEYFVTVYNRELRKTIRAVPDETLQCLAEYDWPGNVRELQSAIKHAFVRASGELLTPDCLPEALLAGAQGGPAQKITPPAQGRVDVARRVRELVLAGSNDIYRLVHADVDRVLLDEILRHVDGNQVLAAQRLGISRTTLRHKLSPSDESEAVDESA
jgi:two-component system nitrogen regulation response regulator GlnG